MIYIKTSGGGVIPLVGRYDGVFEEDQSYHQNSITWSIPTIAMSSVYDGALLTPQGSYTITNTSLHFTLNSQRNFVLYDNDTVIRSMTVDSNRKAFFILVVDNNNQMIIYIMTCTQYEISDYIAPTADTWGSFTYYKVTFGNWSFVYNTSRSNQLKKAVSGVLPPYEMGGTTDEDPDGVGGEGDFTDQDEATPIPSLPSLSAIDTGLVTVYNPSNMDLKNLANYLWSDLFSLDTFKKLFSDPMQAILGLSIVPVQPSVSGSATVTVGNVSTGVSMPKVSSQYVRVDCGTLNIKEYWGAYLDYAPYTKAEIYLPYIGFRQLDIDDIMKKSVHVYYHVDILSGGCVAYIYSGDKIVYTFSGSCASSVPISGQDWTNVINGVLSAAGAIGATIATGGMAAPMAVGTLASAAVNSSKPNVEKSGGISGASGLLSYQKPFIVLTRPRQALPGKQNKYMGYPAFKTKTLSTVSGYVEIEDVQLDSINATQSEIDEIYSLLTTGVIL